jgi:hypothetical protein
MVSPEYLQNFQTQFNQMLNTNQGEKMRKLFNIGCLHIDGKTQCGNGNDEQKPNHIVSAVDENGICLKEELVEDKTNEIKAIPKLLETLKH